MFLHAPTLCFVLDESFGRNAQQPYAINSTAFPKGMTLRAYGPRTLYRARAFTREPGAYVAHYPINHDTKIKTYEYSFRLRSLYACFRNTYCAEVAPILSRRIEYRVFRVLRFRPIGTEVIEYEDNFNGKSIVYFKLRRRRPWAVCITTILYLLT